MYTNGTARLAMLRICVRACVTGAEPIEGYHGFIPKHCQRLCEGAWPQAPAVEASSTTERGYDRDRRHHTIVWVRSTNRAACAPVDAHTCMY